MVLVYSRVGGGHLSAARALAEEFQAAGAAIRLVDAYVECGRFPATRFPELYAWLASRHPRLWSAIYYGTPHVGRPSIVVGPLLRSGLRNVIQHERPDVVISVLPAINGVLAELAPRLEVVLTDWHKIHPFWVAHGVEHYSASTESARNECVRFGAHPDAVDVTGIPVRRQFTIETPRTAQHRLSILAMVGAEGSPRSLRNLVVLAHSDLGAELTVVCGRNERLRHRIEHAGVKALGYVDNIAQLMRSADVLVTKAGGLTLAEAFCCRVPVVVHDLVPGQEPGNLEYARSRGAVVYARSALDLVETVRGLAADAERRTQLVRCGARLAHPDAARRIAANVLARASGDAARA